MNTKNSILVVFGNAKDKKPHAARFETSDESIVRKAAGLMGFHVGRAESEQACVLAKKLPAGKVFSAGKALVPIVKQDLYDQIADLLVLESAVAGLTLDTVTSTARNGDQAKSSPPGRDIWSEIKVGSLVLALERIEPEAGWWEAVVVAIAKDGETMTLRWRDYPKQKQFTEKRRSLGLLAPVLNKTAE